MDDRINEWIQTYGAFIYKSVGSPSEWDDFVIKRNLFCYTLINDKNSSIKISDCFKDSISDKKELIQSYANEFLEYRNNVLNKEVFPQYITDYKKLIAFYKGKDVELGVFNNDFNAGTMPFELSLFAKLGLGLKAKNYEDFYKAFFLKRGKELYEARPDFFSFNLCKLLKFNSTDIYKYVNYLGLSYRDVRDFAKAYYMEKYGVDDNEYFYYCFNEEFYQFSEEREGQLLSREMIDQLVALLKCSTIDEKVDVVKQLDVRLSLMKEFAAKYDAPNINKPDFNHLFGYLIASVDFANDRMIELEEEKREDIKIAFKADEGKDYLLDYANSDHDNITSYCREKGITTYLFSSWVKAVRLSDPEVYEVYREKYKKLRSHNYAIMINTVIKAIDEIIRGVDLDNGSSRPFDVSDYRRYCYKLSLYDKYNIVRRDLSAEQVRTFEKYYHDVYLRNITRGDVVYSFYSSDVYIGVQIDENGKVVPGTGYLLSDEEKHIITDIALQNSGAINATTIALAEKEYLENRELYDITLDSKFTK